MTRVLYRVLYGSIGRMKSEFVMFEPQIQHRTPCLVLDTIREVDVYSLETKLDRILKFRHVSIPSRFPDCNNRTFPTGGGDITLGTGKRHLKM